MVFRIIRLRFWQALRILGEMRWPYRLVLLFIVFWSITGVTVKASQDQGSLLIPAGFFLLIMSLHWLRPDFEFLKIYFANYKKIYLTEYLLLSLPMMAGLTFSVHYYFLPVYLLLLIVLVQYLEPSKSKSQNARQLSFVPARYFEWKRGLRKYFYPILLLWISGLVFSLHMAAGILSIFLIGLTTLGFYDQCESEAMLLAPQQSPSAYLRSRVLGLLSIAGLIYLPIIILFCIFHLQHWYVVMILALVILSYQIYAVTIKYAFFEPNAKSSKNTILLSLGALVFVLPFILPAIWVLTIRLYFLSIKKLNFYLHDFN